MKTFTINDIRQWNPCYDPIKYLPKDWSGTVIDILNKENISFQDRLWCVLRTSLISEKTMRLFAVWCYRQTLEFIKDPDPRSIKAADVAEAFALGKATEEELSAAYSAARSAAYSAYFAYFAASSAAYSAARSAESAAESAAYSAARSAESAARSAESAARSAESAQRNKLIEMILAEGNENA